MQKAISSLEASNNTVENEPNCSSEPTDASRKHPPDVNEPPERESKVWRDSRALDNGTLFGRYAIQRLIGKGGMSEVYAAEHVGLKKPVALKVLRPELTENPEARVRFLQEGECAARIRHSNVVDVTDVGEIEGLPYLVMELLKGEDMGALFAREGHLSASQLLDLMLPVLSAVHAGHLRGVLHRDLKPENIFLHRVEGRLVPKVLDFGVSRVLPTHSTHRMTLPATLLGTPQYMAPEQARGETAVDEKADQYALGVILYQGISGRMPRDAPNIAQLLQQVAFSDFPPPSAHREIAPELERVVLRAMARDPAQRFDSVMALAEALLPMASDVAREAWLLSNVSATSLAPSTVTRPSNDATATDSDVRRLKNRLAPSTGLVAGAAFALLGAGAYWSVSATGTEGLSNEPSTGVASTVQTVATQALRANATAESERPPMPGPKTVAPSAHPDVPLKQSDSPVHSASGVSAPDKTAGIARANATPRLSRVLPAPSPKTAVAPASAPSVRDETSPRPKPSVEVKIIEAPRPQIEIVH